LAFRERRIEFFYLPESEDHSRVYGAVTTLDVRHIHRYIKARIPKEFGVSLESLYKLGNKDWDKENLGG